MYQFLLAYTLFIYSGFTDEVLCLMENLVFHHTKHGVSLFFIIFADTITNKMNKIQLFFVASLAGLMLVGCKDKPKSDDIIAPKPVKQVQTGPESMQEIKQSQDVDWVGSQYKIEIVRTPDKELALTKDESGKVYHDNKISMRILRKDGSQFFGRTFTKADFASLLDEDTRKNGALLGIVLDKTEENQLRFAASVGSPDVLSDQYIPILLTVTRMGAVSMAKDDRLDAGGMEEDEGV